MKKHYVIQDYITKWYFDSFPNKFSESIYPSLNIFNSYEEAEKAIEKLMGGIYEIKTIYQPSL